jgi:uncharacterized membrane protein
MLDSGKQVIYFGASQYGYCHLAFSFAYIASGGEYIGCCMSLNVMCFICN